MNESSLRQQVVMFSDRIWQRGWVANHDGNLSIRIKPGRILCTPTGVAKNSLRSDMLLIVDDTGKVISSSGASRPFSELSLHLAYYHARSDISAVLHAHPPTATGFGVAGRFLDQPFLPEAVVSLGSEIPTVPLALPGADAVQSASPYLDDYDALLLAGNGVLTCGVDLEQAYLRMELVEHLARIALVAHQLGGVQPLPPHYVSNLLEARTRSGLGPEARGKKGPDPKKQKFLSPVNDLEKMVREEIHRVLNH